MYLRTVSNDLKCSQSSSLIGLFFTGNACCCQENSSIEMMILHISYIRENPTAVQHINHYATGFLWFILVFSLIFGNLVFHCNLLSLLFLQQWETVHIKSSNKNKLSVRLKFTSPLRSLVISTNCFNIKQNSWYHRSLNYVCDSSTILFPISQGLLCGWIRCF